MRWVFRIIGALGMAILLALGVLLLLPGDKIARIAAEQVKAQTGRDLTFQGDVNISFWPVLGIETGPVAFGNAKWAGPEPMLQAQSLSIGVAAADLLFGNVRVTRIIADAPDLRLRKNEQGRGNWQFGTTTSSDGSPAPGSGTGASTPITLEQLSFVNARLTYVADGAAPVVLENIDLALDWPNANGPADILATLHPVSDPIRIDAKVTRFAQFLDGTVSPVTAIITAPDGQAKFDGRISIAGEAAGRMTLQSQNTARTLAAVGFGHIDLPTDLGRSVAVAGQVTYTPDGRFSLRDMSLDMDGNALSGAADVVLGDVPTITAQLNAGALDFSNVTQIQPATNSSDANPDESGWSVAPIDAGVLAGINGSVKLSAQSIKTSLTQLGVTRLAVRLDRSRAVMELRQIAIFDGSVKGQLVFNNRRGFSVRGNLQTSGIAVQKALRDLAGLERLSGTAQGHIEFLGAGETVDAIMKSLNGAGGLAVHDGTIAGIDLDHMMDSEKVSRGTTVFDDLTATYTIKDGTLLNDDLLLSLSKFKVEGAGRIGLGARDIDYVLTKARLQHALTPDIVLPIKISGPWSNPNIRPDLSAALKAGVDANVDALEQDAKDELRGKLAKELDVTVEEGQQVEEALKDKLEDKAKKGLLKLLGRD